MKKEFLTEDEAALSRRVSNIIEGLPDIVSKYVAYKDNMQYSFSTIAIYVRTIKYFYEYVAEVLGKELSEVNLDDLLGLSDNVFTEFVDLELKVPAIRNTSKKASEGYKKERKTALIDYYGFLFDTQFLYTNNAYNAFNFSGKETVQSVKRITVNRKTIDKDNVSKIEETLEISEKSASYEFTKNGDTKTIYRIKHISSDKEYKKSYKNVCSVLKRLLAGKENENTSDNPYIVIFESGRQKYIFRINNIIEQPELYSSVKGILNPNIGFFKEM